MTFYDLIDQLRQSVLRPAFMDNDLPAGVLSDNGWALWEMPPEIKFGGYMNAIHTAECDNSVAYLRLVNRTLYAGPNVFVNPTELQTIAAEVFRADYAKLDTSQLTAPGSVYSKGNSFLLQGMIFAPRRTGATCSGPFAPYDYAEVESLVFQKLPKGPGGSVRVGVYLNVGLANAYTSLGNDLDYETTYPQIAKKSLLQTVGRIKAVFNQNSFPPASAEGYVSPITAIPDVANAVMPPTIPPRTGRLFPRPFLNVLAPAVLADSLTALIRVIRLYGRTSTSVAKDVSTFLLGGEFETGMLNLSAPPPQSPEWPCSLGVDASNCAKCLPASDYSSYSEIAFRDYLEHVAYPGPSGLRKLNLAWGGTSFTSFAQIVADTDVQCVPPARVRDFRDFQRRMKEEVHLLHYHVARGTDARGRYAVSDFGPRAIEFSWLHSDLGATLSWYFMNTDAAFKNAELYRVLSATRLSGRPSSVGPSSPPQAVGASCAATVTMATGYGPRCIASADTRLYFRDVLTAGASHIGYYKAPLGFSTFGAPPPYDNSVPNEIALLVSRRDSTLRFMGPHQRVHVHLDPYQLDNLTVSLEPGSREFERFVSLEITRHLEDQHVAYALFAESRVLSRLYSEKQIEAGMTIVPFHPEVTTLDDHGNSLLDQYLALVDRGKGFCLAIASLSQVLGLARSLGRTGRNVLSVLGAIPGQAAALLQWGSSGRCLVLAVPDPPSARVNPREDPVRRYWLENATVIKAAIKHILGWLPDAQVLVDENPAAPRRDVQSNYVTDGINFFIALSNRDPDPMKGPYTVQLNLTPAVKSAISAASGLGLFGASLAYDLLEDVDVATRKPLGVMQSGSPWPVTLNPGQTRFLYARPYGVPLLLASQGVSTDVDLALQITAFEAALNNANMAGYERAHGSALIQHLRTFLPQSPSSTSLTIPYPERVLAGLVELSRMLFLKQSRTGASIQIDAATIWSTSAKAPQRTDVVGADVEILHLLDSHEEQRAGTTGQGGVATLTVATPTTPRYFSGSGKAYAPPIFATANSPVEVHVHDATAATRGAHVYASV